MVLLPGPVRQTKLQDVGNNNWRHIPLLIELLASRFAKIKKERMREDKTSLEKSRVSSENYIKTLRFLK